MNVEIGAEAALFPEKEYIDGIAVAVHIIFMTSSALVPMWTLPISESAELTQWSLYFNWRLLWLQIPLPSSATQRLPSLLICLFSMQGGKEMSMPVARRVGGAKWDDNKEGVGLFQYTVFPARHACVSQCVKVLLWGLVRVFNTVYSLWLHQCTWGCLWVCDCREYRGHSLQGLHSPRHRSSEQKTRYKRKKNYPYKQLS